MTDNTELTVIEPTNAVAIYSGGLDDILARIAKELKQFTPDISTVAGRKEIASRAYKASRCKTQLDDMGVQLSEDARTKIAAINADRKKSEKFLDALRDEIRKPLDDWQAAEDTRIKLHEDGIAKMELFGVIPQGSSSDFIDGAMHGLDNFWKQNDWEEFSMRAENIARDVFAKLKISLENTKKYEADQIELANLREQQRIRDEEDAARKLKEREEQIAKDAAEKARRDAEEEASRKAAEVAQATAAALKAIEDAAAKAASDAAAALKAAEDRAVREKQEADDRAKAAEEAKIASEEKSRADADKAEYDRIAATAKADADKNAAIEAERKRVAEIERADKEAADKREANDKHRDKIERKSRDAIRTILAESGDGDPSKELIRAIADGEIPHIKIIY